MFVSFMFTIDLLIFMLFAVVLMLLLLLLLLVSAAVCARFVYNSLLGTYCSLANKERTCSPLEWREVWIISYAKDPRVWTNIVRCAYAHGLFTMKLLRCASKLTPSTKHVLWLSNNNGTMILWLIAIGRHKSIVWMKKQTIIVVPHLSNVACTSLPF